MSGLQKTWLEEKSHLSLEDYADQKIAALKARNDELEKDCAFHVREYRELESKKIGEIFALEFAVANMREALDKISDLMAESAETLSEKESLQKLREVVQALDKGLYISPAPSILVEVKEAWERLSGLESPISKGQQEWKDFEDLLRKLSDMGVK